MLLGAIGDLIQSWFQKIIDFIIGFFAFIPMTVYFLYASMTSLLDLFQYLIRKLAGLDVYYINGVKQEGDMLVAFIKGVVGIEGGAEYTTLSTVFWSLIIFSVILLVLCTIIALIKAHYNYDAKKSNPMTIISAAVKSIFTIAVVPVVTIFGLYLSEIVLKYLDMLTSSAGGQNIASVFGSEVNRLQNFGQTDAEGNATGYSIYASYDAFGFGGATTTATFSGVMFNVAAYDCNRVRRNTFTATSSAGSSYWENFGIFIDSASDSEAVAVRIDTAFANRITLKDEYRGTADFIGSDSWALSSAYLTGIASAWQLINVKHFSKYYVGLVYYYYDLWAFNYFLGFAGIAACLTLFINIIFGLITRLLMCLALFLVYSPTIGITPIDGGSAFKAWKKAFVENVLMAYGSIVGMNIFFLILPFLNSISFFNNLVLDRIMNALIIISGLSLIKKFMKLLSGFIGAADANETGKAVADDVKSTGMKAAKGTLGLATVGIGVGTLGTKFTGKAINFVAKKIGTRQSRITKLRDKAQNADSIKEAQKLNRKADRLERIRSGQEKTKLEAFGGKLGAVTGGIVKKVSGVPTAQTEDGTKTNGNKPTQAGTTPAGAATGPQGQQGQATGDAKPKADGDGAQGTTSDEGGGAKSGLKAFGQGLLDIGGSFFKLAGDTLGISKFANDLKEGGVFDAGKTAVQKFGQGINAFEKDENGKTKIPKSLQTKKQQEDDEKKVIEEQRKTQEKIAESSAKTLKAIEDLTRMLQKKN